METVLRKCFVTSFPSNVHSFKCESWINDLSFELTYNIEQQIQVQFPQFIKINMYGLQLKTE